MKIAISSTGKNVESNVSDMFGRCPYFIIAEITDKKIIKVEIIENTSTRQMGGTGVSVAQLIVEKDVTAVITGNIGPRALDVLKQFNIDVYIEKGLIKEVLQKFINNKLKKTQ